MPYGQTAADFFDAMNARSVEHMGNLIREDTLFLFPKTQPLTGKDRILKFFQVLFRQYPELSFQVQRIVAQENHVAVHWKNRGVTRKQEHYENEGVTLFEFEEGKISLISDFFKDTGKF